MDDKIKDESLQAILNYKHCPIAPRLFGTSIEKRLDALWA
jgi:hypothetical protein